MRSIFYSIAQVTASGSVAFVTLALVSLPTGEKVGVYSRIIHITFAVDSAVDCIHHLHPTLSSSLAIHNLTFGKMRWISAQGNRVPLVDLWGIT